MPRLTTRLTKIRVLRAGLFAVAAACVCNLSLAPDALAQGGVEGRGSIANEGHDIRTEGTENVQCMDASTDQECREFWEHHINWISWDYKKPYKSPEHRHMPPPFAFALFNFAVFAFIMYRLAAQPLRDFVLTRHLTIRRDLDEAAQLHREAEQKLRDYQAKIAGLDHEIETLLASVRAEAEIEKARIVAAAEIEAVKLKQEARAQIANEIQRVRRELKVEAVNAAVAAAEALVGKSANDGDQVKLAEKFIDGLEKAPGPTSAAARS